MSAKVHYTLVVYGNPDETVNARFPARLVSSAKETVEAALERWKERAGPFATQETVRCNIHIYGYTSRAAALRGSLGNEIGRSGRVE